MSTPAAGVRRVIAGLVRRPVAFPLVVAVASRCYSIALMLLLRRVAVVGDVRHEHQSWFTAWDVDWYLRIAQEGYHATPIELGPAGGRFDFAFFPGWPSLIRVLGLDGLALRWVAVLAANVLFVVALVVLYRVLLQAFERDVSRRAILLLAFSPAAYVFSMGYSGPLFLLLTGTYFLSRERPRAALFAGLAMLTRVAGLAIVASAAVGWLRDRRQTGHLATIVVMGIVFAGCLALPWWLTGVPTAFMMGTASWYRTLGPASIVEAITAARADQLIKLAYVVLVLAASCALLRHRLELGVYAVVTVGLALIAPAVGSMPRYVMMAFPAFGVIATWFGRRGSLALVVAFAFLQASFVWVAFTGVRVPP